MHIRTCLPRSWAGHSSLLLNAQLGVKFLTTKTCHSDGIVRPDNIQLFLSAPSHACNQAKPACDDWVIRARGEVRAGGYVLDGIFLCEGGSSVWVLGVSWVFVVLSVLDCSGLWGCGVPSSWGQETPLLPAVTVCSYCVSLHSAVVPWSCQFAKSSSAVQHVEWVSSMWQTLEGKTLLTSAVALDASLVSLKYP